VPEHVLANFARRRLILSSNQFRTENHKHQDSADGSDLVSTKYLAGIFRSQSAFDLIKANFVRRPGVNESMDRISRTKSFDIFGSWVL
jgi:hypothetical protein